MVLSKCERLISDMMEILFNLIGLDFSNQCESTKTGFLQRFLTSDVG